MAIETWYRGTSTGTTPARAEVHDLGDGLYFTDRLDVAYSFAGTRTKNSDEQLPYVVWGKFDPGARGRVLDLTSGPQQQAWTQFENRMSMSENVTFKRLMAQGGGNYGNMFRIFLAENNLNLDSFDIVIGPEYLRGGRQMCIRNTAVASQIEDLMVPGAPPGALPSNPGTLQPMSTLGPTPGRGQANAGAMFLLFQNVDILLNDLNSKFQAEAADAAVKMEATKIRNHQHDDPTDGALVAVTFSRVVPNSTVVAKTTLIHPGDKFEYVDTYFAPTPEKAADVMAHERELRQGDVIDGPYVTIWRKSLMWVQPRLRAMPGAILKNPAGWWRVEVDKWTWFYHFDAQSGVRWTDPWNNMTGQGTWKMSNDEMTISWAPASKTTEKWHWPLQSENQSGVCVMPGVGTFSVKATFGVQPPANVLNPPLETPVGTWQVKVNPWTWIYEFDAHGGVRWTDPYNGMSGKGTWKMSGGRVSISWAPASKTTEQWDPLNASDQNGTCIMNGVSHKLHATKA